MTRFPTETRQIEGIEGPAYEIMGECACPGCDKPGAERHHLFSRGLMGGAYDWVRLPDGTEIANLVGLCNKHHRQVTENRVHITLHDGVFNWGKDGPLSYQPPCLDGEREVVDTVPGTENTRPVCVTCKRPMPRPKIEGEKKEEKKPRSTWAVAVPIDQRENGAEVLDGLVAAAEEKMDQYGLNWGHGNRVMYFKLVTALALFVQHADDILSDT